MHNRHCVQFGEIDYQMKAGCQNYLTKRVQVLPLPQNMKRKSYSPQWSQSGLNPRATSEKLLIEITNSIKPLKTMRQIISIR
jgi:hypothetical protein